MRPLIIAPIRWPLSRPWERYRVGLGDDGYVPPDSAPPDTSLPEITVSNTPINPPVWPLLVIIGAATYAAYWMGGHK